MKCQWMSCSDERNLSEEVVKVIWQKGCIATTHGWFSDICQVAPVYTYLIHASLDPTECRTWLRHFAQLTAECHRACPVMSFPLKIASWHVVILTPSNTWFPGPTRVHMPNGISIGSAVFAWPPNMDGSVIFTRLRHCASPCNSWVGYIKMPLGTEVGLGPDDIVLDGHPDPHPKRGRSLPPNFRPMSTVAKRLDGSTWHLARRWVSVSYTHLTLPTIYSV